MPELSSPLASAPRAEDAEVDASVPVESGSAFRSLYRRFRPQRFAEVRGQEHVTTALRNAVRDSRVAHAYLFSGPRGTGKTSTARILAKALNCEALEEGEPCGRCASCRAIAIGTSFDVHELDAASSNGVDAMRDLVARAALASPGRWKVYIVDEVHMLSTAASNALLKTLEEPPDHVVFVLATTDPQKVLPTVRSRTQHYEFRLLAEDVLGDLLENVAARARLELPEGALGAAMRKGRGSARDALSALDQVAAGGVLDDEGDLLEAIVTAIAAEDSAGALVGVDTAMRRGRDPQQVAVELIELLRRGFLGLVAPALLVGAPPGFASDLGTAKAVRAMEVLGTAIVAMREAPEPRVTLETAVIRLANPAADDSPAALAERLERLERRVAALDAGSAVHAGGLTAIGPTPARPESSPSPARSTSPEHPAATKHPAAPEPEQPLAVPTPPARPALGAFRRRSESPTGPGASSAPLPAPESNRGRPSTSPTAPAPPAGAAAVPSRDELVTAWGDHVFPRLRPKVRAVFGAGRFVEASGEVVFAVPNQAHLNHAAALTEEVRAALSAHFGRQLALRLAVDAAPSDADQPAGGPPPAGAPVPPAGAAAPVEEDLDELAELDERDSGTPPPTAPGVSWAEESLLRAFPGAEEVTP